MDELAHALQEAGGSGAPRERSAQLRALLQAELGHGRRELRLARSGRERPVTVAVAADGVAGVRAVAPADPAVRVDAAALPERGWAVVAALVGALHEAGATAARFGAWAGALAVEAPGADAELAALAFDERVAAVDRLRARALVVPAHVLAGDAAARPAQATPLRMAVALSALGGDPLAPDPALEEQILAELEATGAAPRPHDDPDPARRVARRILQRLHGMGKWGGYHTAFEHLARGFAGNDRELAERVGEALLRAGLLREKPSVGQRHVFLDPRRAAAIQAFIEHGETPEGFSV